MIRFEGVSVTYRGADRTTLHQVDLEVAEGELGLVVGPTGSGKSTLLGAVNGLVPHFTGGHLGGRVVVAGRDTRDHPPRELADVVGVVGQDPAAAFVATTVEDELAYGMEQLAVPPPVMRKRVEEVLDLLGLADLRGRALRTLSGGQQQRVAIGAVLGAQPRVLVLDEPTSALDPVGAEEVLAAVARLVHDLGLTVLVAEHRLERVVQHADRVVELAGDGTVRVGRPAEVMAGSPLAPPVVRLGRWAGWDPLPLSVRDARRAAGGLRGRLADRARPVVGGGAAPGTPPPPPPPRSTAALTARGVEVRHGDVRAVAGVDLDLATDEVVALMGRNGSGKSSLLWALQGAGRRHAGTVSVGGRDPAAVGAAVARSLVALVPQTPTDLLYLTTVAAELAQADRESGVTAGSGRRLLDELLAGVVDGAHPRDLSEGQRLALVLAVQLVATPPVVLLDEPTRGLDLGAKAHVGRTLRRLAGDGRAVVLATHDVELVAGLADRVVVLADGAVVADGPTAEVLAASPAFAPQVARVLWPEPWLTVEEVARALG